ncbi:hypothetical protein M8C21_000645 [Ambrosia artemisiifolia]|uniref:Uncharacterized protein n=1 Tax=Ambrosia artemisiifolia TaxID=4212 RepID=A0AAD5CJQ2_AMBAR|nr:hypothetical protein M8C21_000645 [Ambrosia artemisiifolia]
MASQGQNDAFSKGTTRGHRVYSTSKTVNGKSEGVIHQVEIDNNGNVNSKKITWNTPGVVSKNYDDEYYGDEEVDSPDTVDSDGEVDQLEKVYSNMNLSPRQPGFPINGHHAMAPRRQNDAFTKGTTRGHSVYSTSKTVNGKSEGVIHQVKIDNGVVNSQKITWKTPGEVSKNCDDEYYEEEEVDPHETVNMYGEVVVGQPDVVYNNMNRILTKPTIPIKGHHEMHTRANRNSYGVGRFNPPMGVSRNWEGGVVQRTSQAINGTTASNNAGNYVGDLPQGGYTYTKKSSSYTSSYTSNGTTTSVKVGSLAEYQLHE